jgi:hypothetical protein
MKKRKIVTLIYFIIVPKRQHEHETKQLALLLKKKRNMPQGSSLYRLTLDRTYSICLIFIEYEVHDLEQLTSERYNDVTLSRSKLIIILFFERFN